jgi:hypothetical protein
VSIKTSFSSALRRIGVFPGTLVKKKKELSVKTPYVYHISSVRTAAYAHTLGVAFDLRPAEGVSVEAGAVGGYTVSRERRQRR